MLNGNEIWKDIPEFNGFYQASNLGRIKSVARFRKGKNGSLAPVKERILKAKLVCGYYQVCLCKQSIKKTCLVHRLVWETFNGTIPEGYEINHLDERPINNALSNLNLVTHRENLNWGTRNERAGKVLKNRKDKSKLVLQYDLQDNFVKEYASTHQVERELGFSNGTISECCNGKVKTAYGYKWRYKE